MRPLRVLGAEITGLGMGTPMKPCNWPDAFRGNEVVS